MSFIISQMSSDNKNLDYFVCFSHVHAEYATEERIKILSVPTSGIVPQKYNRISEGFVFKSKDKQDYIISLSSNNKVLKISRADKNLQIWMYSRASNEHDCVSLSAYLPDDIQVLTPQQAEEHNILCNYPRHVVCAPAQQMPDTQRTHE